jgi:Tol biopolymer transport system component
MADRIGQRLGNYHLVRLVGQGGFADVYLGEHIYLDIPAAIKVLHAQLRKADAEQFRKEARTIARLVRPHIVRVLEFGIEEGAPFLVMDYAPNGTLRKLYPRGTKLQLATVVSYVNQIADALQYAHDQKVIHRDVKPENMLLGRRYEVLLSDFGIALAAQSTRHHSTQGMQDLAGTIAYMAPEQIELCAVAASDQYSLAIVAYEWLCGERPFQGEVVLKALAKDPQQRYPTVKAFARALEQAWRETLPITDLLGDQPAPSENASRAPGEGFPSTLALPGILSVETPDWEPTLSSRTVPLLEDEFPPKTFVETLATPTNLEREAVPLTPALPETAEKPRRSMSRRAILVGAAAGTVALGAGGPLAWLTASTANQATSVTPTLANSTGTALYTYAGHHDRVWAVAWSPDRSMLASAGSDRIVQVWKVDNGTLVYTYTGHTDTIYGLAWSPDSKRIASASYDQTIQIWDAVSGYYPYTYSGHTSWVWTVAWSPDGQYIASAGGDSRVQIWHAERREQVFIYGGHKGYIHGLAWSPDSKWLVSVSSDKTARIWKIADGKELFIHRPYGTTIWSVAWSPDGQRIATACDNKTVQVWDTSGGNHLYIYYGQSDFVYAVAWSPDGKRIASAGDDKTVQVWDAEDGGHAYIYTGHHDAVRAVAWSPDGKRIASASWDKTVKVWQAK